MNTANTAGHTKKVAVNALIFVAYYVSNIIGPQFFRSEQSPLYTLGIGSILASYVLATLTILVYASYCWRENRRRDAMDGGKEEGGAHLDTDFKDLTDTENMNFRYHW
jgi:MFS transporter, ACS family, allantoate permease